MLLALLHHSAQQCSNRAVKPVEVETGVYVYTNDCIYGLTLYQGVKSETNLSQKPSCSWLQYKF